MAPVYGMAARITSAFVGDALKRYMDLLYEV